ncbi:hypothetical protein RI367_007704 [Sorochytrium milnesiophthora]
MRQAIRDARASYSDASQGSNTVGPRHRSNVIFRTVHPYELFKQLYDLQQWADVDVALQQPLRTGLPILGQAHDVNGSSVPKVALALWALQHRSDTTVKQLQEQCGPAASMTTVSAVSMAMYWLVCDGIAALPESVVALAQLMVLSVTQQRPVAQIWRRCEMSVDILAQRYHDATQRHDISYCRPPSAQIPVDKALLLPPDHPTVAAISSKESHDLSWSPSSMANSDTTLPPSLLKHPLLHMSSSARLPTKIVSFKRPNWTLYMSAREALAEFAAARGRLLSFVGVWPCVFQPIRLTGKYVEAPWTLGRFYEERKLPWDLNYCPGTPHLLFASTLGFQWASDEMRHVNELMVDRTLYTYFKYPDIDILLLMPLLTNDRGIRNLSNVTGAEIRVCYRLPFFNHTLDSQYNMPPSIPSTSRLPPTRLDTRRWANDPNPSIPEKRTHC